MAQETPIQLVADSGERGDTLRLRRKIPLIFVPGVMGSRLHFPAINQSWDPDSNRAMMHWFRISADRARRELHFEQNAQVMADPASQELAEDEQNRGWGGVAWDFYGPFLRDLNGRSLPAECPVHAVGYDWRQSNTRSGTFLKQEVDRILEEEEAENCILISHSMGGLVSRAALKHHADLGAKTLGVIHVVQPATGATVAYRRFFTGATRALDGGFAMSTIMGNTGEKYSYLMSGMPGPLQLVPTNNYQDREGEPWLQYRGQDGELHTWEGDVFDLYLDATSPPGVIEHADYANDARLEVQVRTDLMASLDLSQQFHDWLGTYKFDNTYAVFSTGEVTDMALTFDPPERPAPVRRGLLTVTPRWPNRGAKPVRRKQGDATVPDTSASSLFPGVEATVGEIPAHVFQPSARQVSVEDVEHSAAFNDGDTRTVVVRWVERMLNGG